MRLPLLFVLLFKLGEAMAGTMAPAFYRSLGYDRAQVATAIGIPSLVASLLGSRRGRGWWRGSAPGARWC